MVSFPLFLSSPYTLILSTFYEHFLNLKLDFLSSLTECLLGTFCMSDTDLGTGHITQNKRVIAHHLPDLLF